MKASFEQVKIGQQPASFLAYWRREPVFGFNWHYHPAYELTYIQHGKGLRLVGDHTEEFEDGDLVLLGPNLPHTWAAEAATDGRVAEAVVIQFMGGLIPQALLHSGDFGNIKTLFGLSGRGVVFGRAAKEAAKGAILRLPALQGLEKLTALWHILDGLGRSPDYRLLASPLFHPSLGEATEYRIDKACGYVHQHFTQKISLADVAAVANMTETSFCRFFRKMIGKPLMEYVNDLRVSRATNLLLETDASISEVAYTAGFQGTTHFNRMFLKKKGYPPRAFRKQFQGT